MNTPDSHGAPPEAALGAGAVGELDLDALDHVAGGLARALVPEGSAPVPPAPPAVE